MLISGAEDFGAKFPEWDDGKTAEQAVDDAILSGKVSLALTRPAEPEEDYFGPENLLLPSQPAIAVYKNPHEEVVIRQEGETYGEDSFVRINPENVEKLIERLRDFLPNRQPKPTE
jgi:hypothetical protein